MQLSIRGHHQFDLPGQRQRVRFSTGFLSEDVMHAAISRARRLKTFFFLKIMHARPEKMRCTNLVRIQPYMVHGTYAYWGCSRMDLLHAERVFQQPDGVPHTLRS